jgi:hypothetical protein
MGRYNFAYLARHVKYRTTKYWKASSPLQMTKV